MCWSLLCQTKAINFIRHLLKTITWLISLNIIGFLNIFKEYFWSNFRFIVKLREKIQRFSIYLLPPHMYSLLHFQHHSPEWCSFFFKPKMNLYRHIIIAQSPQFLGVHSWYGLFYVFGQVYKAIHLSL